MKAQSGKSIVVVVDFFFADHEKFGKKKEDIPQKHVMCWFWVSEGILQSYNNKGFI